MINRSRTVSARHSKIKSAKKRKSQQGAVKRIITHGLPNEKDGCCLWFWTAFDDAQCIVISDCGMRGNGCYAVTCNSAKFHAVNEALGWLAVNMPDEPVTVFCDVKFIVGLVNGHCKTNKSHLKLLCQTAQELLLRTKATVEWKHGARSERAVLISRKVSRRNFPKIERTNHASI